MTASTRFALGTFAAPDGQPFAGLVLGERVADLRAHLGDAVTVRSLVDGWERSFPELQALGDRPRPGAAPPALAALRSLPPLDRWGQVFCAGANFRQHVLDLLAGAERRGDSSDGLTAADRDR